MTPTDQAPVKMQNIIVRGKWKSGLITSITARSFPPFETDEIPALGGADAAVSPLEYLFGALIGSETALFVQIAQESEFSFEAVEMKLEGEIDERGLRGVPGVKPLVQDLRQLVRVKTDESPERLVKIKIEVEHRCPIFNILKVAGIIPHSVWERS